MIVQPLVNIDPGGSSFSVFPTTPTNVNNNNNNNFHSNNIKLKNTKNIPVSSRFASSQLSPELESSDNLISLATLNVRGLSVASKFNSLLQDFISYDISILGLQETRFNESNGPALFKSFCSLYRMDHDAYWSFDPADPCGGVGVVLRKFASRYVNQVHRGDSGECFCSRFIAVDLFLPSRKLKVVNIYNYQAADFKSKGLDFSKFVIKHLKAARVAGFKVIIMGDFNLDPHIYNRAMDLGTSIPKAFSLIDFLHLSDFADLHPLSSDNLEFATHYVADRPTSRIDLIWQFLDFLMDEYLFSQVWQYPSATLSASSSFSDLDHRCVIVYYSKSLLLGFLPLHRVKQKGLWRSFFDVASATSDQWTSYSLHVEAHLPSSQSTAFVAVHSPLSSSKIFLNSTCNTFKNTLLAAASSCLPVKRVSTEQYNRSSHDSAALLRTKQHLRQANKVFAFLTRLISAPNLNSSSRVCAGSRSFSHLNLHSVQDAWFSSRKGSKGFYNILVDLNKLYDNPIAVSSIPTIIPCFPINLELLISLRGQVATLRNLIRHTCDVLASRFKAERIAMFEQLRCDNFADKKSAFISSSLGRSRRFITLDKAMRVRPDGSEQLVVDPNGVKSLAITHYKTVAGLPPVFVPDVSSFPSLWKDAYSPLIHFNSDIYDSLLQPVSVSELDAVLSSLPTGKAPGLSGIPYEMLKHLPSNAKECLRDLVSSCLAEGVIPSSWKDATIYPIPKPHDWNCYLKNTRPITLLDTVRKVMTKIMYSRLASPLTAHNVLTGGNFAGLPGGSCDPPIFLLDHILSDSRASDKPLFILQQDISKAFDSIDIRMLRLAMMRLNIPVRFINLTLELFSGRYNSIITAYGSTSFYKTEVGIDQGEVISPLLWTIYIDPLLTVLNRENPAPYVIDSNPLVPAVPISTIGYMDDTNLVVSSIDGISSMLNIAQGFYDLDNTKINPAKAIFITNRDPSNPNEALPLIPLSHDFHIGNSVFALTPLPLSASFRFLGVWFSLNSSHSFVLNQCRSEYAVFSKKLSGKRLTLEQLC